MKRIKEHIKHIPQTCLGLSNYLFFQWLCVRLTFGYDIESGKRVTVFFKRWIVPLTGWGSDYRYVWKRN